MKTTIIAFATAILLAPMASAQPPAPAAAESGTMRPPHDFAAHRAEHQAEMAGDLTTVLDLRPNQQAALTAWMAAMAPPEHGPMAGPPPEPATTTPARLTEMEARLAERQGRERTRIEATRHFYAALDARQQRVFDALERMRGGGGHRGPGGMHGPDHGQPDMPPPR